MLAPHLPKLPPMRCCLTQIESAPGSISETNLLQDWFGPVRSAKSQTAVKEPHLCALRLADGQNAVNKEVFVNTLQLQTPHFVHNTP